MIKDQNYFLINVSINAFEESRDLKIPWLERDIQQLDPDLFHRDSFDAPATFAQRLPIRYDALDGFAPRANTIAQRARVIIGRASAATAC